MKITERQNRINNLSNYIYWLYYCSWIPAELLLVQTWTSHFLKSFHLLLLYYIGFYFTAIWGWTLLLFIICILAMKYLHCSLYVVLLTCCVTCMSTHMLSYMLCYLYVEYLCCTIHCTSCCLYVESLYVFSYVVLLTCCATYILRANMSTYMLCYLYVECVTCVLSIYMSTHMFMCVRQNWQYNWLWSWLWTKFKCLLFLPSFCAETRSRWAF